MSHHQINHVQRVRDLRKVIVDRYGRPPLPYTAEGRAHLCIVIDHTLLIARDLTERMAGQFAPLEMSSAELAYLIDRAGNGRRWGMQPLSEAFNLKEADRVQLQALSIGSVDMTPASRRTRKRAEGQQRQRERMDEAAALGIPRLIVSDDA